jgi:GT2 family glycosyltransferase
MQHSISASIVLYNHKFNEINILINSLIHSNIKNIYIIDNSINNDIKKFLKQDKIIYIHNPSNPGFGSSHNLAIYKSLDLNFNYHFIINPDILLGDNTLQEMIIYMSNNRDIGMMMPKILNNDKTPQYLPKLLPTFWQVVLRKLKFPKTLYKNLISKIELRNFLEKKIINLPVLSGCFLLINLNVIKTIGSFDENYFMYFEDWDLSRRIHRKYKTVYYPNVFVLHGYNSEANKKFKLFVIFIKSFFYYYTKWGWFFDNERKLFNNRVLNNLNA